MTPKIWLGIGLIAAGAVLALFFRDLEFFWFRGGPLGIVLIIIGAIDLFEAYRRFRAASDKT
jgi:hypothetical protein